MMQWLSRVRGMMAPILALGLAMGTALPAEGARPRKAAKVRRKGPVGKKGKGRKAREATPKVGPGAIQQPETLAAFFEAVHQAGVADLGRVVRVLQFGDSHTAADFWSGRLRQRLQARFGDGGAGLIMSGRPWRCYPHDGVKVLQGVMWPAASLRQTECDGKVGLAGARVTPLPGEAFQFRATFSDLRIHSVTPSPDAPRLEVHIPGLEGEAPRTEVLPLEGRELEGVPGLRVHRLKAPLAPLEREVSLTFAPDAAFLGVELLSGRSGVVWHELGLNGAELTDLERWDPAYRRALLAEVKPDLLVLAYGTNESGHPILEPEAHQARLRLLLKTLKAESGAPILLVGPLDRSAPKKKARLRLAEQTTAVTRAMAEAARASDCAFWDPRRAMGGAGAIQAYRKKGWAQKDLVHLTGPGYQHLGDLLAEALAEAEKRR